MAAFEEEVSSSGMKQSSFPQNPEEFDADPRVSFSKVSNKFVLETDDGQEFEYDDALRRWISVMDEALMEQQRQAYAVKGVDEAEPTQANRKAKRKKDGAENGTNDSSQPSQSKKAKANSQPRERKNTAVYITNLPIDPPPSVEDIQSVFSRYGIIAEEIDRSTPRIKLYTNPDGSFKGDALLVYFRAESVDLAIQMLDDSEFRLGAGQGNMRVTKASFEFKKVKGDEEQSKEDKPAAGPKKRNDPGERDKKKIIQKTQKLNSKLADWSSDEDYELISTTNNGNNPTSKIVILKHMFTLSELEEDPAAILDIKEDIRDECGKMGEVTNVVLYDLEEDGVASVRFKDVDAARKCVQVMNGRHFSGQTISAYMSDSKEKFQKTKDKKAQLELLGSDDEEDREGGAGGGEDAEAKRLDEFGKWLEEDG